MARRNLCPTGWTICGSYLQSILQKYKVLEQSLEKIAEMSARDPEMYAHCAGFGAQISLFLFFFGVSLGSCLLSLADNLSTSIQSKRMCALEVQELVRLTIKSLGKLCSDVCSHSFGLIRTRSDRIAIVSFLLLHDVESGQPGMILVVLFLLIFQTMQKISESSTLRL